uniref:Centrosomal protein of 192 kDa n=1 Tax=Knipowitschia caucasica TaxID=637954 RepID=A0AAV2MAT6_KNICA
MGSGPGLPVAASTVAKIRPTSDNRQELVEASYLEGREQASAQSSVEHSKFSLNFKDDMDNADDFIAAHRMSDMLVKIDLDESTSRNQASLFGPLTAYTGSVPGRPTELATDLSSGLLTFAHSGRSNSTNVKVGPPLHTAVEEDNREDSDRFSGSNSSFLANEKLMSVDSINSDLSDDDIDLNNLPEDELDQYFNTFIPPDMQRGRVEGQEIAASDTPGIGHELSSPGFTEPDQYRHHFSHDYQQMPDVRLAATGMDSCPASDEDTEDELEAARRKGTTRTRLLPSTSRQLVGESHHTSFRPGLEGGSSDDESSRRGGPSVSGLEHRRSAEGQVINPPITGDGGDGSSGSDESGNDGGVSTLPLPAAPVQTTYDVLRGLGIVGEDQASNMTDLQGLIGDRVGPVGTGETSFSSANVQRADPVNWSMTMDRQEALVGFPQGEPQDSDEGIDEPDGCRQSLGLRGGPCGNASVAEPSDSMSEEEHNPLSTSLEPKYFSQSLHQDDSDDSWTNCPENVELEFQQEAKNTNSVVYQNEQGQWVTDLAYYSSFEKEQAPENLQEFQNESFVAPGQALEIIAKDQEEFEKEHQFIQEENIEPAPANATFQSDSSWKLPSSNYVLMRASQMSDFSQTDQSYLRLSLGQFFEQRSEALGRLSLRESLADIKRPSFGYVITSPEKREPFALLTPTELTDTTHNGTVDLEPDKTLNAEDLDKTIEASKEAIQSETSKQQKTLDSPSLDHSEDSNLGNQPSVSPDSNSSNLMLSISTIASAIADASISTDPSQLAGMIMELSKRKKPWPEVGSVGTNTAPPAESDTLPIEEQSVTMDSQQKSVFDMDKYLRTDLPEKHVEFTCPRLESTTSADTLKSQEPVVDENPYFRPSTSPLTHSSPSQTSFPSVESMTSPSSSRAGNCDKRQDSSPQSICSSPGLSRLTYISVNDGTLMPSPEKKNVAIDKNDRTMSLSTTIIRFSPTPPVEPDLQPNMDYQPHSKSLDPLPPQNSNSPCGSRSGSVLGCSRTQSECNYPSSVSDNVGNQKLLTNANCQQDLMGKAYGQFGTGALVGGLEDFRGQVIVPDELRFPNACCVGIASQTSLSLFNPSERWQQVSIVLSSLSIDGEKVDALPYQWLIVKNKTIIGPKTTEDQKVLFIPPQPGVYQCVLSVCSWPASAEAEMAARANIFAKRVVLVAIAENPAIEVELGKVACLDFGDLPVGGAKALALKLLNRTHATVPIRLVLSANATAWRCFSLSKNPVTSEAAQQAGHITTLSPPAVMNHVMHASYGENPETFVIWVHFKAPAKYSSSMEELGPPDEFVARVDIEVDSPGHTHVIKSIPLKARSGTARVHAPKDLQTVSLTAPLGKSSQQILPLKNAGNIDVQLKLKCSESDGCFSVSPNELSLKVGEERTMFVVFKAQESRKAKESVLTILVLPSGPQYEVTLKGEITSDISGKRAISSSGVLAPDLVNDVPPILSNKQFVAWGGVTLGRAIQQKLVLRNNSKTETQQLRLLIRGQDQDCFQLQSMFSLEERLTRHGELSIRPREDVTVHLLFAPTRVACMMAKLEIKQSGVRPSQPGIKFTIPLSGYGGTSNIILEDQRKQADGYVATLTDVAVGRVSKVCLCVRNTGSRAAFIKAVAFLDVFKRVTMEASVISIAPSQFILKERTQEVITILLKSTPRELSLCQMTVAQLATLCLFCGDEVSRQQYRKLLQSKPDGARKALSENSLLKNIEFGERFLGEELVTETYDLPLRPNEAHLFYGNMSKVVVCLMGSTKGLESVENSHSDESLPSSASDGGLTNGNVSLDVLPVKGPQGTGLKVPEPSLKSSEQLHKPSESWSIHPEQLLLPAPTINGPSATSTVQIRNNSPRALSFDLSWPAHCLTITPQHGVIEPQCHLQILISPNPSLANKSSLLPWSGQIYVQCDGQQKFIKVQIRQDLVLDVSTTAGETMLSALHPQAATPVVHLPRGPTKPLMSAQASLDPVKIRSKTVVFPISAPGETSEAQLEVENGDNDMRWYLSSFAPPYVKGVDTSGDVYRATYTAFRCSKVSGTLGAHEKMQVPFTFLPRDRGDYAQFWDLECHPVSEPQQKTKIRFQLCGTGTTSEGPQERDFSLAKTEPTVTQKIKVEPTVTKPRAEEAVRKGVYSPQNLYTFPATRVGESSALKVNIRNNSADTHELKFVSPREPFYIKHCQYSLRAQHYLKLPVQFKPSSSGSQAAVLLIQSDSSGSLVIHLNDWAQYPPCPADVAKAPLHIVSFIPYSNAAGGSLTPL